MASTFVITSIVIAPSHSHARLIFDRARNFLLPPPLRGAFFYRLQSPDEWGAVASGPNAKHHNRHPRLPVPIVVMSLFKRLSQSLRSLGPTPSAAQKPRRPSPRRPVAQPELTPDLIARSEEALTQRLQQAELALQQAWPRPQLSFTQRGKAAGTAHLQR